MLGPIQYRNCFLSIQHSTFNIESSLREVNPDSCTPIFTAALFTVAKTWKQPVHTHTHTHTHTMEYYSAIKNEEILPFVTILRDLEGIMLSEISQRKANII